MEPHQPEKDIAALHALAAWALRFSPVSAPDSPDGLLLDIAGCEHLFGGEADLIGGLREGLARLGVRAQIACAPTFGAAWALARYGPAGKRTSSRSARDDHGTIAGGIDRLPVCGLRIDDGIVLALAQVGIERIGELRRLPRASIAARYGPAVLRRMDQAFGLAAETIDPVRPIDPPKVTRVFDGPATQYEAVELTVRGLLSELAADLERCGSGVRRLDVTLHRADAEPVGFLCNLARANRNVRHLWSLIRPRLERLNLGFGIESVTLTATRIGRLQHEQAECWLERGELGASEPNRAAGELIDVLSNRLGSDSVCRPELIESHLPERVVRHAALAAQGSLSKADVALVASDRPSALLDTPEPAQVVSLTPEGWPLRVRWRNHDHEIVNSLGPERIGPVWWNSPGRIGHEPRDYFKAQDQDGRWLWLFRLVRSREWFVHGEWA